MDENLIIAYLEGRTTPEDEKEILKHISTSEEERRHLAEMKAVYHWLRLDGTTLLDETSFLKARNSLNRAISWKEGRRQARRSSRILWIASVAACLLAFVVTFSFRQCFLLDGNVTSFNNPDSVATRLTLPDGSIVCLRECTSLSYNHKYNKKRREVQLDGEAFFDVSNNPAKPFIVKTGKAEIVAHGTVFNVKALSQENEIETILASGSVSLHNARGKDIATLKPGQQAIFNPNENHLEIKQVHAWNILLDRYHVVMISEAPVSEVIDIIQKTYRVRLETEGKLSEDLLITFKFQESAALEDVVEMLGLVSGHEFTIVSDN